MSRHRASFASSLGVLLLAGCATSAPTVGPAISPASTSGSAATAVSTLRADSIVGEWTRVQSCQDQLAAFEDAGLAETHATWITENWFAEGSSPSASGDLCAGAKAPVEHSHFFTAAGRFGSRDENGGQVDDGDYVIVDADTLAFPSHGTEFGYEGDLLVDYAVQGTTATFEVHVPMKCADTCSDAYGWAISAFYGPEVWARKAP